MLILVGSGLFVLAYGVVALALPLLEKRARQQELLDHPGGRKNHGAALPLMGGIGILLAVAVPATGGLFLALLGDAFGAELPAEIREHLPGIRQKAPQLLAILLGAATMMLLGHLDDRRGLSPWLRLAVQALAALGLVLLGLRITAYLPWPWVHGLITVLFVVFVTNAVNFIDNMNGLCGGAVLIGSLHLLALAVATGQLFMAAILICLVAGIAAFLPRNFPRARVFLGDAGTLALGFLLASLTIAFTFDQGTGSIRPLLLPLLVLALPLADGLTVVVGRLGRGVHPFTPGHDHLSHRLARRVGGQEKAVLLLWGAAFLAGLPVLFLGPVPPLTAAAVWLPVVILVGWPMGRRWCRREPESP